MLRSAPSEAQEEGRRTPQGPPGEKERVQVDYHGSWIIFTEHFVFKSNFSDLYAILLDPQYQGSFIKSSQGFRMRIWNKILRMN